MLIAQISDLHFLPAGMLAFGQVDVAGCLERAIVHLNALDPAPDLVLITGDLTNDGDDAVYAELVAMLARLDAPYYPLLGNHDPREATRRAFAHLGCLPARGPPLLRDRRLPDPARRRSTAWSSGRPYGTLGAEQLAWLDARLEERAEEADAGRPPPPAVPHRHRPHGPLDAARRRGARRGDRPPPAGRARAVRPRPPPGAAALRRHHRADRARRRPPDPAGRSARSAAPGSASRRACCSTIWNGTRVVTHQSMIGSYGPSGRFSDPHQAAPGAST